MVQEVKKPSRQRSDKGSAFFGSEAIGFDSRKATENGVKIQKTIPQYVTDAVAYDNGHMMIITVR